MTRDRWLGAFAVVAAAFIWGTLGLFAKILYARGVSFESLVAVRAFVGWVAVIGFLLATRGTRALRVERRDLAFLVPLGLVGIGAFYGTIQIVPLLLADRLGVTEHTVGYFVMYMGGMGVVVRTLILGRAVDALGEARLARVGIVVLAAGLAATGLGQASWALAAGFTLMPLGTAFLFPCVTGLLSQAVSPRERGLYMGVQQTYGGRLTILSKLADAVRQTG